MVQHLNEFTIYCQNIGLLQQKQNFKLPKDSLEEILFMHLLTLNREQLIELSQRVTQIWQNNSIKTDSKIESQIEHRRMSISETQTKSTVQLNHLYEQHILKEEKQLAKKEEYINSQMKECTFKPQITKKSQQMELNSPAHIRLNNYAVDSKIKQQIVQEINQKDELKNCTFKPSINNKQIGNSQYFDNPFDRLYQNALTQRSKTPRNDESQYTYRPQLISSPPQLSQQQYQSTPVEDRLYNYHFEKINNFAIKQEELKQQELEQCTFTPLINQQQQQQQTNSKNSEKVFDRLYNHSSMKSISDFKDNSITHINKKSESLVKKPQSDSNSYVTQFQIESNPFDRLYNEHTRQEKKKKSQQIQFYQSIPFKPMLNKKLSIS